MDVITLLAFVVIGSLTGDEKRPIIDQTQLIEVPEGSNLTLQCQTNPEINLTNFTLDWKRKNITNGSYSFVYSRRGGKDHPHPQMQRYRNRAELIKEDLTRGRMTLLIPRVQQSDSGRFKCFISKLNVGFFLDVVVKKNQEMKREDVTMTTSPGNGVTVSGPVEKRSFWVTLGVCICLLLVLGVIIIIGVLLYRGTGICKERRRRADEENTFETGMLRKGEKDGDKDEDITTKNGIGRRQQGQL